MRDGPGIIQTDAATDAQRMTTADDAAPPGDGFRPGFRLSWLDGAVLAGGAAGTLALGPVQPWWAAVIAFVVGHFFVFCNVLRMARDLELIWAGVFLLLAGATLTYGQPVWPATLAITAALTLVLAAVQMRRPSYHGVAWQRINPGLPAWWAARRRTAPPPRAPMPRR